MQTDDRLSQLVDHWVAEADNGRLLFVADLCRDCPELLPEAERQISVLRQFYLLAQPNTLATMEIAAGQETHSGDSADGVPAVPGLLPGAVFSRYQILAWQGRGGMGVVYRAQDTLLRREVALKVLKQDWAAKPSVSIRFLREARALAAVRHDHVVEVYDYGEIDGVSFVTMPLLAGETLEKQLERQNCLKPSEVVRIGAELAEGLAAIHEKGLIHRDVKPSNVWLESPSGRVKLLDFGLARDTVDLERATVPGALVGTPAYMSPEQLNGREVDARSDLFSLGSVLYKAATGQLAFAAPTLSATLAAIGEKEPRPARAVNPSVPDGLSSLIEKLHRKNPQERPATALAVVRELRQSANALETPGTKMLLAEPQRTRLPRAWRDGGIAAALVALLVIAILWIPSLSNHPRDEGGSSLPVLKPSEPVEALRVRQLDVLHFENRDATKTTPRGPFGKESFGATLGDDIKVTARLSRPAYAYLIVFRPDGQDEVLFPQGANLIPELTDEPHYPSIERNKVYGLTDGTGLWLVALVASDSPLPSYAEWRKQHRAAPWTKSAGQPNVVWIDDSQWLEALTPGGLRNRGVRGEKTATGTTPIVSIVDWLKSETGGTGAAVGFTVEPAK
jgi:serine/threonine protein kinase